MTWFIVDGMDGSGKTTVASVLKTELESQGRKVLLIEHPNRNTILGRIESKMLQVDGKAAMMAATLLYVLDVIRSVWIMKHDSAHDDVIFVRYIMAVSYLHDESAKKAYKIFEHVLPTPDVKILVDVDEHTAYSRITSRGDDIERFEKLEILADTRRKMLMLSNDWIVLDNNSTSDKLVDVIRELLVDDHNGRTS